MLRTYKKEFFTAVIVLAVLLIAAYIPDIHNVGFLQDDWNTLFMTEQRGAGSLVAHFAIDRPLRGYFGLLEDRLFGTQMVWYQISALTMQMLGSLFFFATLMLIWPKKWKYHLLICSLLIVYPGFHELQHAFDYQAHIFSRMCILFSIFISVWITFVRQKWLKAAGIVLALASALAGYGLMEVYIGMEGLRLALFFTQFRQKKGITTLRSYLLLTVIFIVNSALYSVWRLFFFETRRASVNAGNMLAAYQDFFPKIGEDLVNLFNNMYRLCVSAYYQPLLVFARNVETGRLLAGLAIAIVTAALVAYLIWKGSFGSETGGNDGKTFSRSLIGIGLFGAAASLIPIIFGGREIVYNLLGDRFSYPGAVSACMLIVGLLSLLKNAKLQTAIFSILIGLSLLTQFANDEIFRKNYLQTNAVWWQMAWRAPQIKPATLLSGEYPYGMLDEDYTLWGPANLIYYPGEFEPVITAEIISGETLPKFLAQGNELYTRRIVTYERNFGNLLIFSKGTDSCLHMIDGEHAEFSQSDADYIQKVGVLSDIDRIDAASSYQPEPRVDLFGAEPARGWCYYYQKAQLARQQRNWTAAADFGHEAWNGKYSPADPMEWLVFLQAFAYTNDPLYEQVKERVKQDEYTSSQVCGVVSTYSAEMSAAPFADAHQRLMGDFCK
jgi:hypothetical protein